MIEQKNKYYFFVHPEFKKIAANENIISFGSKLSFVTVLKSEYSKLFYKKSSSTLLQKKPYEFYKILIKYAKKFNASKCLLLTLNSFLRPLIIYQPIINFINGLGRPKQQMVIAIGIIVLLIPSEILLFKIFNMGVALSILPPVIVTVVRIILGFFQLRRELKLG